MGLIASREFVTVRRFEKRGEIYVSAGISTDQCEDMVPKSNYVRCVFLQYTFLLIRGDRESNVNRAQVGKNFMLNKFFCT